MTTTPDLQRRTLRVLVVAQVLSGAGLAAGITVGALLAQDMLGSTGLAGLPSALFTAGSALAAVAVGRISQSRGRRPGLATGYAVGAVGSAGIVVAAVVDSPALLFASLFVYGAGSAANLQARYAGADLADADHRARAISTVLVATTLGGVVGPLLAAPTGDLAPPSWGIPHLAGPFLLAGVSYVAAALVLADLAPPRPAAARTRGRGDRVAATAATPGPVPAPSDEAVQPRRTGRLTVMVAHPGGDGRDHDDDARAHARPRSRHRRLRAGDRGARRRDVLAVADHRPSRRQGRPDPDGRRGRRHPALCGRPRRSRARRLGGLARAGLGIARPGLELRPGLGYRDRHRCCAARHPARTQGAVDVSIAIAGAGGGLASGIVVDVTSYSLLSLAGGILALAILPAIAASARVRKSVDTAT